MESASVRPIASLERLRELGLDPAKFGSCSAPEGVRGWRGTLERLTNVGCRFHAECKWANVPMPDPTEDKMRPRPRNVKTRLIKPKRDGSGKDAIRENYCSCAQWHHDLKKRHGKNDEIAEVCGMEGSKVLLLGSKSVRDANGTLTHQPTYFKQVVPVFPDPEDSPDLLVDVYAAASRHSDDQRQEDELQSERDRRMATTRIGANEAKAESLGDGNLADLKEAYGTGDKPGP